MKQTCKIPIIRSGDLVVSGCDDRGAVD